MCGHVAGIEVVSAMGSANGCEASVPDAYAECLDMTAEPTGGFIQLH
jgi:hypothetical protein